MPNTLPYFKLLQLPVLQDPLLTAKALLTDGVLDSAISGDWNITNQDVILLADDL